MTIGEEQFQLPEPAEIILPRILRIWLVNRKSTAI